MNIRGLFGIRLDSAAMMAHLHRRWTGLPEFIA